MRKFVAFVKVTLKMTVAYRAESLVWFVLELIPLVYMLSLWQSLRLAGRINQTQYSQLFFYYVAALFISRLFSSHFEDWIIDEIKDGKISRNFVKPFSLRVYLLAEEITWRAVGIIYLAPVLVIALWLFRGMEGISAAPGRWLLALIVLVISFLQRFFMSWLVCLTAFWIQQSKSLVHFKWMMEGIFGGSWLPLYFFPAWFEKLAKFTPFYTWYYFPIRLIGSNVTGREISYGVVSAVVWVVVLFFLGNLLWKKAIVRYSAVGG